MALEVLLKANDTFITANCQLKEYCKKSIDVSEASKEFSSSHLL